MKRSLLSGLILLFALAVGVPLIAAESYPWQDHADPFDFYLGNHFDAFQQSQVDERDQLQGFLYVRFTGEFGPDGLPLATHGDCAAAPDDCQAGWMLRGLPVTATLVAVGNGAPTWCIAPESVPTTPGFTHFHWLDAAEHPEGLTVGASYEGYLLKLTARDAFRFAHHAGSVAVVPGIDYYSHANVVVGC
jgi:hypothetical protein